MSVNDEEELPWLMEEKRFIDKAIVRGKTVIGICLGAQLIADVLGARVYKNKEKEIGWWPITLTDEGKKHPLTEHFPDKQEVFHWHGETFDLPNGAVRLAGSELCENQAFVYSDNVLGLQFHMESTAESIQQLITNCASDITKGPGIQTLDQIRGTDSVIKKNNELVERLMGQLVGVK